MDFILIGLGTSLETHVVNGTSVMAASLLLVVLLIITVKNPK